MSMDANYILINHAQQHQFALDDSFLLNEELLPRNPTTFSFEVEGCVFFDFLLSTGLFPSEAALLGTPDENERDGLETVTGVLLLLAGVDLAPVLVSLVFLRDVCIVAATFPRPLEGFASVLLFF